MRSSAAHRLPSRRDRHAATRALACLAAALAVVNGAFWLWPVTARAPARLADRPGRAEEVTLQFIEPVRPPPAAPAAPPPPAAPAPAPPVEVSDERPPEEAVADLPLRLPPAPPPAPAPSAPRALAVPAAPPTAPPPAGPRLVERPDRAPRLVRAALPVYPPEARRGRIRARARVRVLVGEGGEVLDAEVVERAVLDGGVETAVAALPFGLEAAALDAARRHRFQAARDGGERVRSWAVLSLTFDPPR